MENILSGNPLLNLTGPSQPQANFKVKRRYYTIMGWKYIHTGYEFYSKLYYVKFLKYHCTATVSDFGIMEEGE